MQPVQITEVMCTRDKYAYVSYSVISFLTFNKYKRSGKRLVVLSVCYLQDGNIKSKHAKCWFRLSRKGN